MKSKIVKELHQIGVYRDLQTKRKLECMKMVDLINLLEFVKEEQSKGVVFGKKEEDYVFVTPKTKKDKVLNKKRR